MAYASLEAFSFQKANWGIPFGGAKTEFGSVPERKTRALRPPDHVGSYVKIWSAMVAVSTKGNIAVLDLKTLEVIGQISAGNQPDGLAWAVTK
jgi:hypothetical protein